MILGRDCLIPMAIPSPIFRPISIITRDGDLISRALSIVLLTLLAISRALLYNDIALEARPPVKLSIIRIPMDRRLIPDRYFFARSHLSMMLFRTCSILLFTDDLMFSTFSSTLRLIDSHSFEAHPFSSPHLFFAF